MILTIHLNFLFSVENGAFWCVLRPCNPWKKLGPFLVTVLASKMNKKWLEKFCLHSSLLSLCSKCSLTYAKLTRKVAIPALPSFPPVEGDMWGQFFTFVSNFHRNLDYKMKHPNFRPVHFILYEDPDQNHITYLPQIYLSILWPSLDGKCDIAL